MHAAAARPAATMSQITPHIKAVRYVSPVELDAAKTATHDDYRSLYRRSLRLALDWAVQRNLWRGQAVYIRSLFDANRNVHDPRQRRVRLTPGEHPRSMTDNSDR